MKKISKQIIILRSLLFPTAIIFIVSCLFYFKFTADDSYIVYKYAENFIDHGSLVYNLGEPINALTSPLHALLETLLYKLTSITITSYKILSFILLLVSLLLVMTASTNNLYSQLISCSILMLSPSIILWTFGGMETPLLLFLITVLTVLMYKTNEFGLIRYCMIFFIAGLVFMTRYDSILFIAPLIIYASIKVRSFKKFFLATLLGSLIPLAWLSVSVIYYGDLFPTSFYCKTPSYTPTVILSNSFYVFSYLILSGFIPFFAFLFFQISTKKQLLQLIISRIYALWWIYMGMLLTLIYGLSMATVHMMFSFRFFMPYTPVLVFILIDIYGTYSSHLKEDVIKQRFNKYFSFFLIMFIAFQSFQLFYTYNYSLNGLLINYEYGKNGVINSTNLMEKLEKAARDIKLHWESLDKPRERPPRIHTFAAGILPYTYKDAYIYETLISYRHNCKYEVKLSSDYILILTPRHGIIERQLPNPVDSYELISSGKLVFDGEENYLIVAYNPNPGTNKIPPGINENCRNNFF